MACSSYNMYGFGCSGCPSFVKSTAVTVVGTNLRISIPNQVIRNRQQLCIAVCQSIPDTITQDQVVQISVNGTNFSLINECGNYIYADQIKSRKVLRLYFATDTLVASVKRACLCPTSHGFPVIPVPAPATASTQASVAPDVYSYTDKEV